jgi:hypothetical protein
MDRVRINNSHTDTNHSPKRNEWKELRFSAGFCLKNIHNIRL